MSELRSIRWLAPCVLLLAMGGLGCVSERGPESGDAELAEAQPGSDPPRLHLELIEKMLESGKAHAALAHLDALPPKEAAASVSSSGSNTSRAASS